MAISTQIQNLNLIPGKSAPVVVHLSQGNVGNTVQFYLYDGDNPYYPTNVSIAVHGVRANNTVFGPYAVSVTSGSNLVSFDTVATMTSVTGAAIGELVISDSTQNQIGSANFGMLSEETPYSSTVTYEDDLSIYQRILAYVQSIPASISGQVATEATARTEGDDSLRALITSQITTEATARTEGDDSLRALITSETAARQTGDTNLQSQINQYVSPSTEQPTEVTNARVDYHGTTHATLKARDDSDYSNLLGIMDLYGGVVVKAPSKSFAATSSAGWKFSFTNMSLTRSGNYYVVVKGGSGHADEGIRFNKAESLDSSDVVLKPTYMGTNGNYKIYKANVTSDLLSTITHVAYHSGSVTNAFTVEFVVFYGWLLDEIYENRSSSINALYAANDYDSHLWSEFFKSHGGLTKLVEGDVADTGTGFAVVDVAADPSKITGYDDRTYRNHWIFDVTENDLFVLCVNCEMNVPYHIFQTDATGNILKKELGGYSASTMVYDYAVRIVKGATKLVVDSLRGNVRFYKCDQTKFGDSKTPSYYYVNNYWPNKLDEINAVNSGITDGMSFVFWTDPHFNGYQDGANPKRSKPMMKDILDETSVEFVVCGGDLVKANGNEQDLIDAASVYKEYVKALNGRVYGVRGNHDFTIQTDDTSNPRITEPWAFAYDAIIRPIDHTVMTQQALNGYYYVDVDRAGIRMIFTNTYDKLSEDPTEDIAPVTVTTTQLNWIYETILASPYDVLVFGHCPIDPTILRTVFSDTEEKPLFKLLAAAKNKRTYGTYNFSSFTHNVIAFISGHVHDNYIETNDNLLSITSPSDSYWNVATGEARALYTITEQAFDVVAINKATKRIDLIRCGAGANRVAYYT